MCERVCVHGSVHVGMHVLVCTGSVSLRVQSRRAHVLMRTSSGCAWVPAHSSAWGHMCVGACRLCVCKQISHVGRCATVHRDYVHKRVCAESLRAHVHRFCVQMHL